MKKKIRIIVISLVALLIIVLLGTTAFLYQRGFRITYDPDLDTKWEAVSACANWTGIIVALFSMLLSFAAIIVAIQVPRKIADRQDRIALFEKRYEVYQKIQICLRFGDNMGRMGLLPSDRFMYFRMAVFPEKNFKRDVNYDDIEPDLYNTLEILRRAEFLFEKSFAVEILGLADYLDIILNSVASSEEAEEKIGEKEVELIKLAKEFQNKKLPMLMKEMKISKE